MAIFTVTYFMPVILLWLWGSCFVVKGWQNAHFPLRKSAHYSRLYKGKSPSEAGLSKKQLFRQVRAKIEEASKRPGFFDPPEGWPDMELYCPATSDGKGIGDCTDSQFVQMVLVKKGVFFVNKPVLSSSMSLPSSAISMNSALVTAAADTVDTVATIDSQQRLCLLPMLRHQNNNITHPLAIAEHIETCYPHKSLVKIGKYSYQEAIGIVSPIWKAIRESILSMEIQHMKTNSDISAVNKEILERVLLEFMKIDQLLRTSPGQYVCGIDMTLADLYLTPVLFRAVIAIEHFFKFPVLRVRNSNQLSVYPALEEYMLLMFNKEMFKDPRVYCDVDKVIHGWKSLMAASFNS